MLPPPFSIVPSRLPAPRIQSPWPPARTRCFLLDLPREIRNMIYDNLTSTHAISVHKKALPPTYLPPVYLDNTVCLSVMRLNHQIHDEYVEYILPKSRLSICFYHKEVLPDHLHLSPSFPAHILQKVRQCALSMAEHRVRAICNDTEHILEWRGYSHEPRERQNEQAWTPSKSNSILRLWSNFHNVH